jgi:DNA-directed RNA polymerase subunit RPC12/RpoP
MKNTGIFSNSAVLVLNCDYSPINITSWRRAIVLLLKEKAIMLTDKVIKLVDYVFIPLHKLKKVRPSRSLIYKRDNNTCQYCGSTRKLTLDHVLPRSKGGRDTWSNLVVACSRCNTRKGDKLLEHCDMELMRKPFAPNHKTFLEATLAYDPDWKKYGVT